MGKYDHISNGELFKDIQESLMDIFLVDMIKNEKVKKHYLNRKEVNKDILEVMKTIMEERFEDKDLARFLDCGYPLQINMRKAI